MNIKEYSTRQIIGVGTATIFFVIIVQEIGSKNFSEIGVWICVAFIGIYCLALGILKNDKYPALAAAALVLCSVCAEYTVANTNNYSMDQTKVNFVGDYDNFQEIKSQIDEYEGNDDYRMELTSLRARMDPCWYNYNGVSTFSSMAYEKVSNMQSHMGMFSNYINSYTYHRQTPVYNAFFSLDYIVDNAIGSKAQMNPELYKEIATVDKYTAYENRYQLPIAFRVNSDILQWSHDNVNPFEVQSSLFGSATGIHTVYNDMEMTGVSGNGVDCNDLTFSDEGYYPYTVTDSAAASVSFELTVKESGNGYLYLKSSNNDISAITVSLPDGTSLSQNIDTKPHILDLGALNAGEVVQIYAPFSEVKDGYLYLFGVTLNSEAFTEGYNQLKTDSLNVTEFDDTVIKGTINASEDGILYTSINYDEGWAVYIDGEKVGKESIYDIGDKALLGVEITEGEHSVTFKYTPRGLYAGIAISVISFILLIILCFVTKSKVFKFNPPLYVEEETVIEPVDVIEITDTSDEIDISDADSPEIQTDENQ